jgi:ribosomal protein S18 acetylase RimI-like enzyme
MTEDAIRAVRDATPADLEAILEIERGAFDAARRSSNAALRRALQSSFQRVLVLERAGELAGYVILWPYRHTWRIYNLASHPAHRNRGVGGALLGAAIALARHAGARRLLLESRDEPALLRFYRQRGFLVTGELRDYYAPGAHALRMELSIGPAQAANRS